MISQTSVWLRSSFQLARPRMPHGYHRRLKAKEDTNKDQKSSEGQGEHQQGPGVRSKGVKELLLADCAESKERCTLTREFPHWCKEENLSTTTARDDSIPTRDDSVPVRDDPIRCETERYGARRSDTVRDEAIRCETRRSGLDTLRYGAIRDDPSAIRTDTGARRFDTGARRFDTGSRKPSACQTCNKRCLRGGHHY